MPQRTDTNLQMMFSQVCWRLFFWMSFETASTLYRL